MTNLFNVAPPTYFIPQTRNLDEDDREYLREQTWHVALKGEGDPNVYVEHFGEELEAAAIDDVEAVRYFESVIALRRNQQAAWSEFPVSNIEAAFAELAEVGVVARADFTCCGSCASAEIGGERDESRHWRGYLYFHTQDTDRLVYDRQTYVGYGAFLDAYVEEAAWTVMGETEQDRVYVDVVKQLMVAEVFPILEKRGIGVEWNQDLGTRILLTDADYVVRL